MRWAKLYEDFVRDQRLTLRDFRVYSALSLFADKEGNCHPKREQLAEITGLPADRISEVTSRLVRLGWIGKTGDGGKSRSSDYRLLASPLPGDSVQTLTDLGRDNETVTLTDLGRDNVQTLTDLVSQTLTDLGRGKQQPIKQPKLKTNSPVKKGASAPICVQADMDSVAIAPPPKVGKPAKEPLALPPAPDWLPTATWQAFIDHRVELKKPLTVHAAQITLNHLDQARGFGHAPVVLIEAAIASGWTGCVFERHLHASQPSARSVKSHVVAPPKTNPDAYKPTGRFASAVEMTA